MDRFLADAQSILETACAADGPDSELTILVGEQDSIRIRESSGAPLAAVQQETGARTAFRITRTPEMIQVEGRSGSRSCLLQHKRRFRQAQLLLNAVPVRIHHTALLLADSPSGVSMPAGLDAYGGFSYASHSASSSRAYSADAYSSK